MPHTIRPPYERKVPSTKAEIPDVIHGSETQGRREAEERYDREATGSSYYTASTDLIGRVENAETVREPLETCGMRNVVHYRGHARCLSGFLPGVAGNHRCTT